MPSGHVPTQTELIITSSLHEATILGTVGVKPFKINKGPDVTPQQTPKIRWLYVGNKNAEEVLALWRSEGIGEFNWEDLSDREKRIVISHVSAFAGNLKHYLAHTK